MQRASFIRSSLRLLRDCPSLGDVQEDTVNDLQRRLAMLLPQHQQHDLGLRPSPATVLLIAMGSTVFFEPYYSDYHDCRRFTAGLEPYNRAFARAARRLLDLYLTAADDDAVDDHAFIHAFAAWSLRIGAHIMLDDLPLASACA